MKCRGQYIIFEGIQDVHNQMVRKSEYNPPQQKKEGEIGLKCVKAIHPS